jgi:sugar transferase (PEP-CTERM/EpsH1 system associated)
MSKDLAGWLQDCIGVSPGKVRQLYNGVDTDRFSPIDRAVVAPPESIVVGTVGRLDPVKNQARLLRAVAEIRRQHPQLTARLRLLIVGDGPLRASLESLAVELRMEGIVEFAGARADTPDLLRRMDLFVLPSINEGISNTVLEAMASGLPVVAARVGGNPELVSDGVTGCLYDPAPESALPQALVPYLRDSTLRHRHGCAGRERVLQDFGLDAMVQGYLGLYDELLAPV